MAGVAWYEVGAGPPLLLINGYAATGRDWDPGFLLALERSFRLICPDNRGIGDSALGDEELSIAGLAVDMEALLDSLGLERATVAGWSMGGFVAQALAARAPARIDGLALLSSDPGGPGAIDPEPAVWARLIDHTGTPREQATRLVGLLFPPALAPEIDHQFGDLVARARAELPEATLFAQEAAMTAWHREEQPASPGADFPIAIGHGSLDVVIPPGNADALARRWPGASVEVFDGCAHALMAQEPARAAALIVSVGPDPA